MKDAEKLSRASGLGPRTLEQVCRIAKDAGAAILDVYGEDDFNIEYKDDSSPLTTADKASHEIIIKGLQQHFPDIPILSEEGADIPYGERKDWQRFWLVDPLDGTKEFIKRNGEFTVNIALIENQQPVLGVVYVPAQDKMYSGIVGEGAWVRQARGPRPEAQGPRPKARGPRPEAQDFEPFLPAGSDAFTLGPRASGLEPLRVRTPEPEQGLTVVMSRSHPSPELEDYLQDIHVARSLPVGSSLKLCVVAEGRADLYPRLGPTMEWDTAAGHAIVLAAGGTVKQLTGANLVYNKKELLNPYFVVSGERLQ